MSGSALFQTGPPEAIAVVGASMRNFYTRWTIENLRRYHYPGRILPVNRQGDPILGIRAYESIEDLPGEVELGVIGVRAERCVEAARQLVQRGCRSLVVLSDGFSETGTAQGRQFEQEMVELCRASDVLLVGPNGVGFADFASALACLGEPIPSDVTPGPISVVSQSGGMLATLLAGLTGEGAGIDLAVSVGNGAGLDVAGALEACLARPATRVIAAYLEGFGVDVGPAIAILERIRAGGKRLFVVKPGRTAKARRIVTSHTATLAGPDAVVRSMLAARGVVVLDTMEQLVRTCRLALAVEPLSGQQGIAVLGSSGGAASVTSDMAAVHGVPLSAYSDETERSLRELVPDSGHVGNPIDLSGRSGGGEVDTERVYELIAADPTVRVLLVPFSAILPDRAGERASHRDYLELLAGISDRQSVPLVVSTMAGQPMNPWLRDLEYGHDGTVVVVGLDATMAALGALSAGADRGRGTELPTAEVAPAEVAPAEVAPAVVAPGDVAPGAVAGEVGSGRPESGRPGSGALDEADGRSLLSDAGFPVVPGQRCDDDADLGAIASDVGFPLVVKGILPGVSHKAAIGGVVVGLSSPEAVVGAVTRMRARCQQAGIAVEGVLLERMVWGVELLVGLSRDPGYGPAVTIGLGGALAETTPLHATAALPLVEPGGLPALIADAGLVEVVARSGAAGEHFVRHLHQLCASFVSGELARYQTVEINPVFLTPTGEVWAADVLIVV